MLPSRKSSKREQSKSTRNPYDQVMQGHKLKSKKGVKGVCSVCDKPFKGFRKPVSARAAAVGSKQAAV